MAHSSRGWIRSDQKMGVASVRRSRQGRVGRALRVAGVCKEGLRCHIASRWLREEGQGMIMVALGVIVVIGTLSTALFMQVAAQLR
jgi:hypothetical protein